MWPGSGTGVLNACTARGWAGLTVNAWFEARNKYPDGFRSEVRCQVTVAEETVRFGWDVFSDEDVPFAHWEYELAARGEQTLIRQWFTHGPGDSGMRMGVLADPTRAAAVRQRRLDQLERNMLLTIEAMARARSQPTDA